ncbi:EthD family reductase [Leeuwenhoekiella sp. LLG6367-2.1]|uniref:EthD family reductase n=1 Tax=Leeuwenhoekiella sp. LLG6367-2.1 TaxID=3160833 RepID=UPI003864932F
MIKLTVMYPNNVDLTFDKDYYLSKHGNLIAELLGEAIIDSDVNFGIASASPTEPAPYAVIANITFKSMESFEKSFGANAETILKDLPNFTNAEPVVQLSEVV